MKITKFIMLISSAIFFILAGLCFFEALFVEIDAYDFAVIYASLNPAKVFILTSVIILSWYIVLYKRKNGIFDVEKVFALFVALLFVSFGYSYFTRTNGNEVVMEKAVGTNSEFAYELNKKYLPYYVFSAEETAEYEIFKGKAKSTTMVYVDSDILNPDGNMQYEAEFLKTNSPIIYYKYLLSKTVLDETSIAVNGKEEQLVLEGKELKLYSYGNSYAVCISENKKVFYVTLSNVKDISIEDFARTVIEQFELMEETVKKGRLLE